MKPLQIKVTGEFYERSNKHILFFYEVTRKIQVKSHQ